MTLNSKTLGSRLRFFRKLKGLKQMDIELQSGLSAGVLSRIEHNTINPTKETIDTIAHSLLLTPREKDFLNGVTAFSPSEKEIELAKSSVQEYFSKPNVFAYLIDDRSVFHDVSKAFPKILGWESDDLENFFDYTTVQITVRKDLPVLKHFAPEYLEHLFQSHLPAYYSQVYFMFDDPSYQDTERDIALDPLAKKIWEDVKSKPLVSFNPEQYRYVHLQFFINGERIVVPMQFSREHLFNYPRFEVVEYTPMGEYADLLKKFM